jgi:hypothetical protein
MELYRFIEETRDHHLTIGDLKMLEPGSRLEVAIFDWNFEEYWIWNEAVSKQRYDPKVFFERNRRELIYKGDMSWDIVFPFGTINHPVHIEIRPNYWCPVDADWQQIRDGCTVCSKEEAEGITYDLQSLPDSTRIGWRGPIIRWKDIDIKGEVYYIEGYFPNED